MSGRRTKHFHFVDRKNPLLMRLTNKRWNVNSRKWWRAYKCLRLFKKGKTEHQMFSSWASSRWIPSQFTWCCLSFCYESGLNRYEWISDRSSQVTDTIVLYCRSTGRPYCRMKRQEVRHLRPETFAESPSSICFRTLDLSDFTKHPELERGEKLPFQNTSYSICDKCWWKIPMWSEDR